MVYVSNILVNGKSVNSLRTGYKYEHIEYTDIDTGEVVPRPVDGILGEASLDGSFIYCVHDRVSAQFLKYIDGVSFGVSRVGRPGYYMSVDEFLDNPLPDTELVSVPDEIIAMTGDFVRRVSNIIGGSIVYCSLYECIRDIMFQCGCFILSQPVLLIETGRIGQRLVIHLSQSSEAKRFFTKMAM